MSCLPIVSDRAATKGSKYFELGRQPHDFLTRNTCYTSSYKHTDNLSRTLQAPSLTASEGQEIAELTRQTLQRIRSNDAFDLF